MKKKLPIPVFCLLLALPLFAQEENPPAAETVFVIRKVEFAVEGRTKPSALGYYGEIEEGERIAGRENFEKYLAEKQQLIMNRRVHNEVSIEYTLGEAGTDGALPVDLVVHVKDSWNIIALPEPRYDSNEGFSLTLKARDYNFLGTMNPLRLDLGYLRSIKNDETKNIFRFEADSDTPFFAGGLRWNFNFDHIADYTAGDVFDYKNVTGISVALPVSVSTLTLGADHFLLVNEENSQENIDEYGLGDRFDGAYGAGEIYGSWRIPTGVIINEYDELVYTVRMSGKISYRPAGGLDDSRRPITFMSQKLGFGKINWIGNYREGLEAYLENTNYFYFDHYDYRFNLFAGAIYHHRFSELFGFSSRLRFGRWYHGLNYEAGSVIRGFPAESIRAKNLLSLNLDFPFRIIRFVPSEWFESWKTKVFNFDVHFSPFFDSALAERLEKPFDAGFIEFTKPLFGGGAEMIVFPDFFRSLYLRASLGYNLNKLYDTHKLPRWDELFIGMGHFY